jgi:hypothetical protein
MHRELLKSGTGHREALQGEGSILPKFAIPRLGEPSFYLFFDHSHCLALEGTEEKRNIQLNVDVLTGHIYVPREALARDAKGHLGAILADPLPLGLHLWKLLSVRLECACSGQAGQLKAQVVRDAVLQGILRENP